MSHLGHTQEQYVQQQWQIAQEAIAQAQAAVADLSDFWDDELTEPAIGTARAIEALFQALANLDDLSLKERHDIAALLRARASQDPDAETAARWLGEIRRGSQTRCADPDCLRLHDHY